MDTKEMIIQLCSDILDNPDQSKNQLNNNIFVFNKYQLSNIPTWIYDIITVCIGVHKHLSVVIFDELMNSISVRKFNDNSIPSDYIIIPEDWIDCYEDGYPFISINKDIFDEYSESFCKLLNEVSRDELTAYLLHTVMMNQLDKVYHE